MRSIARFTVAISSASEWRASYTAITLYPAFCRIGITLLHEENPSAHVPWTRMILYIIFVIVALPYSRYYIALR
jgi:hypothetical protein